MLSMIEYSPACDEHAGEGSLLVKWRGFGAIIDLFCQTSALVLGRGPFLTYLSTPLSLRTLPLLLLLSRCAGPRFVLCLSFTFPVSGHLQLKDSHLDDDHPDLLLHLVTPLHHLLISNSKDPSRLEQPNTFQTTTDDLQSSKSVLAQSLPRSDAKVTTS